jgi:hypothetical protein
MPSSPTNPNSSRPADAGTCDELAAEDFYFEGPYMVFTAAYHLKRGYCCHADCRHCPYRDAE